MQLTIPPSASPIVMDLVCLNAAGNRDTTQTYLSTSLSVLMIDTANGTHSYSSAASTVESIGTIASPATPTTGKCGFIHVIGGDYLLVFRADDAGSATAGRVRALVTTSAGEQSPVGMQSNAVPATGPIGGTIIESGTGSGQITTTDGGVVLYTHASLDGGRPLMPLPLQILAVTDSPNPYSPSATHVLAASGSAAWYDAGDASLYFARVTSGPYTGLWGWFAGDPSLPRFVSFGLAGQSPVGMPWLGVNGQTGTMTTSGVYGDVRVADEEQLATAASVASVAASQTNQATTGQATNILAGLAAQGTTSQHSTGSGTDTTAIVNAMTVPMANGTVKISGSAGAYTNLPVSATATIVAADVASAVWNATASSYTTSGSTGSKLSLITAGGVQIVSGYDPTTSTITITRGDAYNAGNSNAITITDTGSTWAALTPTALSFTARKDSDNTLALLATMALSTCTMSGGTVTITLANASTSALTPTIDTDGTTLPGITWAYEWDVQCTTASGVITLASGVLDVRKDVT